MAPDLGAISLGCALSIRDSRLLPFALRTIRKRHCLQCPLGSVAQLARATRLFFETARGRVFRIPPDPLPDQPLVRLYKLSTCKS